jgi:hypothetical protein
MNQSSKTAGVRGSATQRTTFVEQISSDFFSDHVSAPDRSETAFLSNLSARILFAKRGYIDKARREYWWNGTSILPGVI